MAGEPILIVDDTPINLKLTRILLANEGYKVQTAASAEEALEMLRGYHPRLILADIQLPGIDGLEMTRRLKRDENTKDITVVALTAFAMKGDEQKAREAGCDGYITKPIDTRTLGARIREYLDRRKGPRSLPIEPPEVSTDSALADAAGELIASGDIIALRRRFLSEGEQGVSSMLKDLDGSFNAVEAGKMVHQWVGTGGLLGYPAIGRISREVEGLVAERPIDTAEVRQALANLAFAFFCQKDALDLPVPQPLIDILSGKRIAIVGMPVSDAQRLAATLERASAQPFLHKATSQPAGTGLDPCDLAVIYVQPGTIPWERRNRTADAANQPALVFVGRREDLFGLDRTFQSMASALLMDSWQPEEALVRISVAISQPRTPGMAPVNRVAAPGTPLHVLLTSADASLLALVRTTFENFEMKYETIPDGTLAVDAVRRLEPDAMVLDTGIPGMDGYQVLSAIRAEGLEVPVLLLAARHQDGEIVSGMALGAADFLFKPFSPLELVARLKRLIGL